MSTLRSIVTSPHKRLSSICLVWAAVQLAFAYIFGGYRLVSYPIAIACPAITLLLWIFIPIAGRKITSKTISQRFYSTLRNLMIPSFLMAFVLPFICYWRAMDKIHFAVVVDLSICAYFCTLLAHRIYGEFFYRFLGRGRLRAKDAI